MSDDAERRQRRQFEPPPWERERFEALARQRASVERKTGPADAAAEDAPRPPEESAREAGPGVSAEARTVEGPEAAPAIDGRKVEAMLIELSGEEGSAKKPVVQAGKVTAIVLVAIGLVMMVIAAVLAVRWISPRDQPGPGAGASAPGVSRPATESAEATAMEGGIGAAVIAVLGSFVAGFAGWMWVRANREQGS